MTKSQPSKSAWLVLLGLIILMSGYMWLLLDPTDIIWPSATAVVGLLLAVVGLNNDWN